MIGLQGLNSNRLVLTPIARTRAFASSRAIGVNGRMGGLGRHGFEP
jgi:hypothetical protein